MASRTKLSFNNNKLEQTSGDTVNLSGTTNISGNLTSVNPIRYDSSISFSGNSNPNRIPDIAWVTGGTEVISFAYDDEVTSLEALDSVTEFRMPYQMNLLGVRASLNVPTSGSSLIVDINQNSSSILSQKLHIDAGASTSTTASIQPVISDNVLLNNTEITVDIDQIGALTAGAGLKVYLIGNVYR